MALIPFMHMDTLFIRCFFLWRTILWASRSPKDQMWHQWEICMSNICVQGAWTEHGEHKDLSTDASRSETHRANTSSAEQAGGRAARKRCCRSSQGLPDSTRRALLSLLLQSDHSHHVLPAFTMKFSSSYTANGCIFGSHLPDKRISRRCY